MGLLTESIQDAVSAVRSFTLGPFTSDARDPVLARLFGARQTATGISVTEETALNYSVWWSCVKLIAGTVGALPLHLFKRLPDGGRERFSDHYLERLILRPNTEMTDIVFRTTMTADALTWGNAYAEITLNPSDRPAGLHHIEPWRVDLFREPGSRRLRYRVSNDSGPDTILRPDEILHLKGLSPDGLEGYSVVAKARESIGLGLAQERYGATLFKSGASLSGWLTHPGRMTPEARDAFEQWLTNFVGMDRAGKLMLLEEGIEFHPGAMPAKDAEFLGGRQFQGGEICRWFNMPPSLVGVDQPSGLTYRNSTDEFHRFLKLTLNPLLVMIERELDAKLVRPLEQGLQYFEHVRQAIVEGDPSDEARIYAIGWGKWLTTNDIRTRQNLPKVAGGDTLQATPSPSGNAARAVLAASLQALVAPWAAGLTRDARSSAPAEKVRARLARCRSAPLTPPPTLVAACALVGADPDRVAAELRDGLLRQVDGILESAYLPDQLVTLLEQSWPAHIDTLSGRVVATGGDAR